MKKIILILVSITTLISCSKTSTDDNLINNTPQNLIGTWKNVGYYNDEIDPITNSTYHPITDGIVVKYNNTGIFVITYVNGDVNNGTFSVSNDSIITHYNNAIINIQSITTQKLTYLSENEMYLLNLSQLHSDKYIKVNSSNQINGN